MRRRKSAEQREKEQNFVLPPEEELHVKNNHPGSVERSVAWDKVDASRKRMVVKHIQELLPELKMQPQRILHYLRIMYISKQNHLIGLEKALSGQVLTKGDIIPENDFIEMMPVLYPETAGLEDTEDGKVIAKQILNPVHARFIENIKKGMPAEDAAIAAGFTKSAIENDLKMIMKPNPNAMINSVNHKRLLLVWKAYWDSIKERVEAAGISEDYVLSKLKKQADFNVKELFDENGNMIDIKKLDDDTAKLITEIKITETKHVVKKQTETRTIMIKLGNRENALKELAKLQKGIFNHVNEKTVNHRHSGGVLHAKVDASTMDEQTLDRLLALGSPNETLLKYDDVDIHQENEDFIDAEYEESRP